MEQRNRVGVGWRIAAGVLGALGLAAILVSHAAEGWRDWRRMLGAAFLGALFLWVATNGRSPGWLERLRDEECR